MKAIERIYKYLDLKGVKPTRFEKNIGLSNGYLGTQLRRKGSLGEDVLNTVIDNCLDLNPEWLLTGKGDMLKKNNTNNDKPLLVKESALNTFEYNGLKKIPLVGSNAVAGFGNSEFSIKNEDVKDYYVIPLFNQSKVDFMIQIFGDSMLPTYRSGDIVACSIVKDSTFIQWNKPHIIATMDQGILLKRILDSTEPNHLILKSDNKEFPPFSVPKSEIKGLAIVIGVIRVE